MNDQWNPTETGESIAAALEKLNTHNWTNPVDYANEVDRIMIEVVGIPQELINRDLYDLGVAERKKRKGIPSLGNSTHAALSSSHTHVYSSHPHSERRRAPKKGLDWLIDRIRDRTSGGEDVEVSVSIHEGSRGVGRDIFAIYSIEGIDVRDYLGNDDEGGWNYMDSAMQSLSSRFPKGRVEGPKFLVQHTGRKSGNYDPEAVMKAAYRLFPQGESGERVSSRELSFRFAEIRRLSYPVPSYSNLRANEKWKLLLDTQAQISKEVRETRQDLAGELESLEYGFSFHD